MSIPTRVVSKFWIICIAVVWCGCGEGHDPRQHALRPAPKGEIVIVVWAETENLDYFAKLAGIIETTCNNVAGEKALQVPPLHDRKEMPHAEIGDAKGHLVLPDDATTISTTGFGTAHRRRLKPASDLDLSRLKQECISALLSYDKENDIKTMWQLDVIKEDGTSVE